MYAATAWRDRIYALALASIVLAGILAVGLGAASGGSGAAIASISPTAVPTATAAPQPSLDAQRVDDLRKLADALEAYRARFGAYPSSGGGVQWACKTGLEAACALTRVAAGLRFSDGMSDYLYRSDGKSYRLITKLDVGVTPDGCSGVRLPADLSGTPAYCIGA